MIVFLILLGGETDPGEGTGWAAAHEPVAGEALSLAAKETLLL